MNQLAKKIQNLACKCIFIIGFLSFAILIYIYIKIINFYDIFAYDLPVLNYAFYSIIWAGIMYIAAVTMQSRLLGILGFLLTCFIFLVISFGGSFKGGGLFLLFIFLFNVSFLPLLSPKSIILPKGCICYMLLNILIMAGFISFQNFSGTADLKAHLISTLLVIWEQEREGETRASIVESHKDFLTLYHIGELFGSNGDLYFKVNLEKYAQYVAGIFFTIGDGGRELVITRKLYALKEEMLRFNKSNKIIYGEKIKIYSSANSQFVEFDGQQNQVYMQMPFSLHP